MDIRPFLLQDDQMLLLLWLLCISLRDDSGSSIDRVFPLLLPFRVPFLFTNRLCDKYLVPVFDATFERWAGWRLWLRGSLQKECRVVDYVLQYVCSSDSRSTLLPPRNNRRPQPGRPPLHYLIRVTRPRQGPLDLELPAVHNLGHRLQRMAYVCDWLACQYSAGKMNKDFLK